MPGYGARNQIAYQSGRLSFNDHIRRRLNHNASMSSRISQPDNTFHSFYLFKKIYLSYQKINKLVTTVKYQIHTAYQNGYKTGKITMV